MSTKVPAEAKNNIFLYSPIFSFYFLSDIISLDSTATQSCLDDRHVNEIIKSFVFSFCQFSHSAMNEKLCKLYSSIRRIIKFNWSGYFVGVAARVCFADVMPSLHSLLLARKVRNDLVSMRFREFCCCFGFCFKCASAIWKQFTRSNRLTEREKKNPQMAES